MIDHTGLQVSDPVASRVFYDNALAPLGYKMPPKADFWVGEGAPNAPRVHVAFRAETRRQVDEFYRAALTAGGKDNGRPGPRPHYHQHYYGAFVLDPDGHNVEAVCHEPK
jgi:catechol 2,3-dioxygenase-like lactoylglutathione lyase family enzyme